MVYSGIYTVYGGAEFCFTIEYSIRELVAAAVFRQGGHVQVHCYLRGFLYVLLLKYFVVLYGVDDVARRYVSEAVEYGDVVFPGKYIEVVCVAKFFAGMGEEAGYFYIKFTALLNEMGEAFIAYGLGTEENDLFCHCDYYLSNLLI